MTAARGTHAAGVLGPASNNALRPIYTLVGDEVYFRDRFRRQIASLLDPATRDFSLLDLDLSETPLDEALDLARTPSLLAPLQILFLHNARDLFGRGGASGDEAAAKPAAGKKKHGDFPANLERYARLTQGAPPSAVLVFVADHVHLPADRQRIGMEDKSRLQRIEATLGAVGEVVYCGRVPESEAAALARQAALDQGSALSAADALTLVQMLDGNLAVVEREVEKLALHAAPGGAITAEAIAALVPPSRQGSGFELALLLA
ncbi:MAG: DNA polymerase III subunit delta, partial [Terriglobales bacterium]